MLHDRVAPLQASLAPGLARRAALFVNHILSREPVALSRLAPHTGRRIECRVSATPAWWQVPPLRFEISRAGLLDADIEPHGAVADVLLTLDASDPLAAVEAVLAGHRPAVSIEGDAALAADLGWLIDHLRWDIEDDLEQFVGPAAARGIARTGSGVAAAALGALASLRRRRRPAAR